MCPSNGIFVMNTNKFWTVITFIFVALKARSRLPEFSKYPIGLFNSELCRGIIGTFQLLHEEIPRTDREVHQQKFTVQIP